MEVDAARICCSFCEEWKLVSTNFNQIQVKQIFWRILEDNKRNKREKVGAQYKSLCAIHQAGYVCQTYSSNKMNSLPLSFLPSRPCLFWWILPTNSCLLVFNSIFQWKTKKLSVFWKYTGNHVMSPNSAPYFGSSLPYWLHIPHEFEGRQLAVFAQLPLVPTLLMQRWLHVFWVQKKILQ